MYKPERPLVFEVLTLTPDVPITNLLVSAAIEALSVNMIPCWRTVYSALTLLSAYTVIQSYCLLYSIQVTLVAALTPLVAP